MIHIEGLSKSFQDGDDLHEVLGGVHLDIEAGDFVALVGRSGSGKSTLLHCIAGIETPDSGRIEIAGVDLAGLDEDARTRLRRDRIGIVFQFFHLLPALSVRDNVELPAQLRGEDPRSIRERSHALLDELGLLDRAQQYPDRLSGGEQQRVAIARALINEPALLLADEPTGNLDADTAETILQLFRQIHEKHGVTILMVTHSKTAAQVANRVAELAEGEIEWDEPEAPAPKEQAPEATQAGDHEDAAGVETSGSEPENTTAGIRVPAGSGKEGVRPSAKAAALFAAASSSASEDEGDGASDAAEDENAEDESGAQADHVEEAEIEDAVDEALTEANEDNESPQGTP